MDVETALKIMNSVLTLFIGFLLGSLLYNVNEIDEAALESMIRSDNPGSIEVYHDGWHTGTLTWEPKAERKE
jgi:hypothetical protein